MTPPVGCVVCARPGGRLGLIATRRLQRRVSGLVGTEQACNWPMTVGERELQMVAPPVRAPWDDCRFEAAPALGEHSASLRAEFALQDTGEPARSVA